MSFYKLQYDKSHESYNPYNKNPNMYLYENYNTKIYLEEQNDWLKSLKVKKINCEPYDQDIYDKTKYIQHEGNNNFTYISPVPVGPLVEAFDLGQTIPVSMVNDGIIFDDINDAVEYAKSKHNANFKQELEKKELKRQEELENNIVQENAQKKTILYFVVYPIFFMLFIMYSIFVVMPWIIVSICTNTWNCGFLFAIRLFWYDLVKTTKKLYLYCYK